MDGRTSQEIQQPDWSKLLSAFWIPCRHLSITCFTNPQKLSNVIDKIGKNKIRIRIKIIRKQKLTSQFRLSSSRWECHQKDNSATFLVKLKILPLSCHSVLQDAAQYCPLCHKPLCSSFRDWNAGLQITHRDATNELRTATKSGQLKQH